MVCRGRIGYDVIDRVRDDNGGRDGDNRDDRDRAISHVPLVEGGGVDLGRLPGGTAVRKADVKGSSSDPQGGKGLPHHWTGGGLNGH